MAMVTPFSDTQGTTLGGIDLGRQIRQVTDAEFSQFKSGKLESLDGHVKHGNRPEDGRREFPAAAVVLVWCSVGRLGMRRRHAPQSCPSRNRLSDWAPPGGTVTGSPQHFLLKGARKPERRQHRQ